MPTTTDYVPDTDALSLVIGTATPSTLDASLREALRFGRIRVYSTTPFDQLVDGAPIHLGDETIDVVYACGPSCARAIVDELDGEFVDAGLNAYIDADSATTVDLTDADLGNDDESPCARTGCDGVIVRAALLLPCGCRPHTTRMTQRGFRCDTEDQGYCNFECPHDEEPDD